MPSEPKEKKKKEPRVTINMLKVLYDPELRRVCMQLLGIPTLLAWGPDPKERVNWFMQHLLEFADADLNVLEKTVFREPVLDYLAGLQAYIKGEGPAPVLNPVMGEIEIETVQYTEPEIWERDENDIEDDDDVTDQQAKEELAMAVKINRFSKPNFGADTPEPTPPTPPPAEEPDVVVEDDGRTGGVQDDLNELKMRAAEQAVQIDQLNSQLNKLCDAFAFLINNVMVAKDQPAFESFDELIDAIREEEAPEE